MQQDVFQTKFSIVAGVLQACPIPWSAWGQVQLHLRDGQRNQGMIKQIVVCAKYEGVKRATELLSKYSNKGEWGEMSKTKFL